MIRRWTLHVDVGCGVLANGPHDDVDVDGIEVIELAPVVEALREIQKAVDADRYADKGAIWCADKIHDLLSALPEPKR